MICKTKSYYVKFYRYCDWDMSHDFSGNGKYYYCFSFSLRKYKNDDVNFVGVCTEQACSFTSGI